MSNTSILSEQDTIRGLRRRGLSVHQIGDGLSGGTSLQSLPAAAVAAGTDQLTIVAGTGTEVVARDTNGRFNLKSQATTPADNDNILWTVDGTTNILNQTVSSTNLNVLTTRVALNTITACFFSAGWDQNITDADPTGTAGDGVQLFYFAPGAASAELADGTAFDAAGITASQRANWIIAYKVNGTDTFAPTSIPVVAGRFYTFQISMAADRTAGVLIDGVQVGKSPALTNSAALRFKCGAELTGTPGGQKDFSAEGVWVWRP